LGDDIGLGEEAGVGIEPPDIDFESEPDEFQGKKVISVGDDQVIDLGDESDLEQGESFETPVDSWSQDEKESVEISTMPEETKDEEPVDFEKAISPDTDEVTPELQPEQDQEDDFMASLEDIDIDLEEEATKILEEQESIADNALSEEVPAVDVEESVDLTLDKDLESEEPEITDFVQKDSEIPTISETSQESPEGEEMPEEFAPSEMMPEIEKADSEELEELPESEVNGRELLGVTLRLSDMQMEEFEGMVNEARTLQNYLDGLETHKTEIKETIYQKLQDEYISRKTSIFSAAEFISILADVEQDLQEMLTKRTEFVSTIERLNEELEEITVRHLVGEYDEATLSEREKAQEAEIALWNEKTEKIESFITRYQESVEAERELNPLRKEQELVENVSEESETESITEKLEETPAFEQEDFSSLEEIVQEGIQESEEEDIEEDDLFGIGEETTEIDEFDEESLVGSEFSMDSDFEGDVDLDALSKVAEEFAGEQSGSYPDMLEAEETTQEEMVSCKKCGRQTPAAEKFCVHCGAKAQ
jgi:hypothetical protein